MGDKITYRRNAEQYGVPTVPGITAPVDTADRVKDLAAEYGYPLTIKAAHGGGGKGLRVAWDADEVDNAFESREDALTSTAARSMWRSTWRSQAPSWPRVSSTPTGTGLFFGERDCSVQRRHHKLIEETASPGLSPSRDGGSPGVPGRGQVV